MTQFNHTTLAVIFIDNGTQTTNDTSTPSQYGQYFYNFTNITQNQSNTTTTNDTNTTINFNFQSQTLQTWQTEFIIDKYHQTLRNFLFSDIKEKIRPNCLNNLPLFISFSPHHKSGSFVSRRIKWQLLKYCNIIENSKSSYSYPTIRHANKLNKYIQNTTKLKYNFIHATFDNISNNNITSNDTYNYINSEYNAVRDLISKLKFDFNDLYSYEYFARLTHWPLNFPNINYFINNYYSNIILLNYIRSPLNIIISGFHYHSDCRQEPWIDCKFIYY